MTDAEIMRAMRQAMFEAEPGTHEVRCKDHRIIFEVTEDRRSILAAWVGDEQTFPKQKVH